MCEMCADAVQAFPLSHQGGRGHSGNEPRVDGGLRRVGGKPLEVSAASGVLVALWLVDLVADLLVTIRGSHAACSFLVLQ